MIFTLYNVNYVAPRCNTAGRLKRLHVHTRAYTVYILQSYILSMYTVCKYIKTIEKNF